MSKQELIDQLTQFTSEVKCIRELHDNLLARIKVASTSITCGAERDTTLSEMSLAVTHLRAQLMTLKLNLVAVWIGPDSIMARVEHLQNNGQWLPMKFFGDYHMMKTEIGNLERECFGVQGRFEKTYGVKNGFVGDMDKMLLIPEPYIHDFVPGEFPNQ